MNPIEAGDNSSPLQLHRVSQAEADLAAEILHGLDWHPTFAIMMPLDCGDDAIQRARVTLRSLARQGYGNWHTVIIPRQLDLSFDTLVEHLSQGLATTGGLRQRLMTRIKPPNTLRDHLLANLTEIDPQLSIVARHPRVRLAEVARRHCSDTGPLFLVPVQPGDQLSGDALIELAIATGRSRKIDFLYSDEQRPDPVSGTFAPFLKPQWSPDLLLSTNYIGRLWCASADLFDRAGVQVAELPDSNEYDLVLRCTEQAKAIHHVSRLLCRRWNNELDGETAERQALERALVRRGIDAEVADGRGPGMYRVKRRAPENALVSIIIPTNASGGLVATCITSILRLTAYRKFEIVIVDNVAATDRHWKTWVQENADKVIPAESPFNWSRFNNLAAREASGEYLLFLNDDTEVLQPDWLHAMLEHAQRAEVGVVGPQLLYADGTVQHAGMFLAEPATGRHAFRHKRCDQLGYFGLALMQRNVSAVTGACLMTRRDVFCRLGGFNELHDVVNNDLDYCLRVRQHGLAVIYTPHAVLRHHERASRGDTADHHDHASFNYDWRQTFAAGDPYHNPHLSQRVDDLVPEVNELQVLYPARPLIRHDAVQRILLVKLDHIGDCVGAVPAVRRLAAHFPNARLVMLSGEWTLPIWRQLPEIDEVIPFQFFHANSSLPPRKLLYNELQSLAERLQEYNFDLAIDLRGHPETRDLLRHSGARYTAGVDQDGQFPWLDVALGFAGDLPSLPKSQHFSATVRSVIDAVIAACETEPALLSAPQNEMRPTADLPRGLFNRRVICVHVGGGNAMKLWPAAHYAELINLLVEHEDVNIALIGGRADEEAVAAVLSRIENAERIFSLVGALSLDDLMGTLSACALFIGNDSGPKHIAAAIGVPTLAIHSGYVDAREWAPLGPRAIAVRRRTSCSPCYLTRPQDCGYDLGCLVDLRPRDVYPLCQRLLALRYGSSWDMRTPSGP